MESNNGNTSEIRKVFFRFSSALFNGGMPRENAEVYEFGSYRLDVSEHRFERVDGAPNGALTEKAFQTLTHLVRNHGNLVTKDELLSAVWPDTVVEENNLDKAIHSIRHALGEKRGEQNYIETVRKYGYRFVAEVTRPNGGPMRSEKGGVGVVQPRTTRSSRWILGLGAGAVLVTLLGLGSGIFNSTANDAASRRFNFNDMQRLTANDKSSHPAISPDGKFVAYVLTGPDRLSIQLMQVDTRFRQRLYEPPDGRDIAWLSFSHDGNYVYFVQAEPHETGSIGVVYRIGLLAASPERLVRDVAYYGLARNGASLAFVRNSRGASESLLFTMNLDGSNERLLAKRSRDEAFSFLGWSADDRFIAVSVGSHEQSGARMFPVIVDLNDGSQRVITEKRWQYLSYLLWLSDGSGLLANGIEPGSQVGGAWHISLTDGRTELLGELPSIYTITGQTIDSKMLIAQTGEHRSNIWVADLPTDGPVVTARQLTTGNDGGYVTFIPDGRLLFTSMLTRPKMPDIWTMQPDGSDRRQITEGPDSYGVPISSPDGGYLVFESGRGGRSNIWRMDADGANPIQLTFGNNEKGPSISPDGRWVYYRSPDDTTIRRVSMGGGESEVVASKNWTSCIVSPDGRSCLSSYRGEGAVGWQFGLLDLETGHATKLFAFPDGIEPGMGYQWMPDGKAFIYAACKGGEWNIWKQPIDGGPAIQLTDLKSSEDIYSPAVSPDGRHLAFGRGGWTTDIFLIKNFQ